MLHHYLIHIKIIFNLLFCESLSLLLGSSYPLKIEGISYYPRVGLWQSIRLQDVTLSKGEFLFFIYFLDLTGVSFIFMTKWGQVFLSFQRWWMKSNNISSSLGGKWHEYLYIFYVIQRKIILGSWTLFYGVYQIC